MGRPDLAVALHLDAGLDGSAVRVPPPRALHLPERLLSRTPAAPWPRRPGAIRPGLGRERNPGLVPALAAPPRPLPGTGRRPPVRATRHRRDRPISVGRPDHPGVGPALARRPP